MKTTIIVLMVSIAIGILICGCQKLSDIELSDVFVSASEIDKMLVNYALAENGAKIYVSEDNPNHPASTLNNGITSSEKWHLGEGWEDHFEGRFSPVRYVVEYGEVHRQAQKHFDEKEDYKWRGLRGLYANYAMGWVIVELPEPKRISRVNVWTVDSEDLPVEKYGVSDVDVHYWEMKTQDWKNVDRYDKKVGQKAGSICGNVHQKIVIRFKPVNTDKVRIVIRWTNDAEEFASYDSFGYVESTIRLTEIELYGSEKKSEGPQKDIEIKELLEEE